MSKCVIGGLPIKRLMMNFCTPKPRTKKRGITIKSENKGKTPNKVKRKNVIYIASIINSP